MNRSHKNILSLLVSTSALLLVVTACSSRQDHRNFTAASAPQNSKIENVLVDQGDLTMFYYAIRTTGVAKELDTNGEYTIFAPTNTAFSQIKQNAYPCFYTVQCRPQLAAILRNHIVPKNEGLHRLSKQGGDIPTLGNRRVDVEEPYIGHYTIEGYRVLYQKENSSLRDTKSDNINLYRIDGVIASNEEMAPFKSVPVADGPEGFVKKTVTTYQSPQPNSYGQQVTMPNAYMVPGGYALNPAIYTDEYDDLPTTLIETTTVTHTSTPN